MDFNTKKTNNSAKKIRENLIKSPDQGRRGSTSSLEVLSLATLSSLIAHPFERLKILTMATKSLSLPKIPKQHQIWLLYSGLTAGTSRYALLQLLQTNTLGASSELFMMNMNYSGFYRRFLSENLSSFFFLVTANILELEKLRAITYSHELAKAKSEGLERPKFLQALSERFSRVRFGTDYFRVGLSNSLLSLTRLMLMKGVQEKYRKIGLKRMEEGEMDQTKNLVIGSLIGSVTVGFFASPLEQLRWRLNHRLVDSEKWSEGDVRLFSIAKEIAKDVKSGGVRELFRGAGFNVAHLLTLSFGLVLSQSLINTVKEA